MDGGQLGAIVVMLVVGLTLSAWQLAILVNWRGYGEGHVARSIKTTATLRRLPLYRDLPPPDRGTGRRFVTWTQRFVAAVLLLAGLALVIVALSLLVREFAG